ncbi:MAG: hypothetical protein DWQ47_08210 [Acidobacteria bacterium]|nr:MAG: hypothetical protein DWQ32_16310 [Acidobacteriota bacterium]REJ99106.1 MAG: hypothetical protein DWQ38_13665 [Acidobacteriota bacterium]REK16173.1 MAG: hypothetical protein DWQ43_04020 [Acidobacteriota bacterium]REK43854.1 MAG: hypothetical protein DWQ47_08210 [Acidobacteriota bacterium]
MKEDLALMERALTELHPGLYRYNTKEEFARKIADFEAKLNEPLREDRFFLLTAQLLSGIKCGHTYLNPYNQKKEIFERLIGRQTYIPFHFRFIDGFFVITENASEFDLPKGSAITSINGRTVDEIVQGLVSVSTADGDGTTLTRLRSVDLSRENGASYAHFDLYFPIFFPLDRPEFEIEAISYRSKEKVRLKVPAMTKQERTAAMEKKYGKTPGYDEGWSFKFLKDGTGYLKIDNFITWKLSIDYKRFLADSFSRLKEAGATDLIIDIRNSDGGDAGVVTELLRYLHKDPFSCETGIRTFIRTAKADPELLKYASVYDQDLKAALLNGVPKDRYKPAKNGLLEFLNGAVACPETEPYADRFDGDVYLLTGPDNASAAFTLAKRVKEASLATLVGRSTGGNLNGFNGGSYLFFNLPNSGFEFDIPVFAYHPADSSQAKDSGIEPDVNAISTASDAGEAFDRTLDKTLRLIKEKQAR